MPHFDAVTLMNIRIAADIIRDSHNTVILTGAGLSTPSGIPDFRSPQSGLWEKSDPTEVASLTSFRYHPEKFYHWMRPLAQIMVQAQPNQAHLSIAQMETAGFVKTVITQNIDGLHQRAGSCNVLEVHGTIDFMTCVRCYQKYNAQSHLETYLNSGSIPRCTICNGILKPDIVLFGEQMPARVWLKAMEACKTCDVMLVAGSSLEVLPVAGLPMRALENGAHLILVNRARTYMDVRADVVLNEDVIGILPNIVQEVLGNGA